jgi:hypothetical protein
LPPECSQYSVDKRPKRQRFRGVSRHGNKQKSTRLDHRTHPIAARGYGMKRSLEGINAALLGATLLGAADLGAGHASGPTAAAA